MSNPVDVWAVGEAYEPYVGRWSRLVAAEFLSWLAAPAGSSWLPVPAGSSWLDVGCGTGALASTILHAGSPAVVVGVDRSEGFARYARRQVTGGPAWFAVADAAGLPLPDSAVDAAVSGLVLNFVPAPDRAAAELARVTRPGGTVAAYVWDYAGRMQLMRYFWDAAGSLDPAARVLDEGPRFPLCDPDALRDLFQDAGLSTVEVRGIEVPTRFRDFDDFWSPFLGGQGPAPAYAMSLTEEARDALRELLRGRLPYAPDGSIPLVARAWAVRGTAPYAAIESSEGRRVTLTTLDR